MTTPIQAPSGEPVGESATRESIAKPLIQGPARSRVDSTHAEHLNGAPGSFPHTPDATLEGYGWPEVTAEQLAAADELTRMAHEDGLL